MAFGTLFFLFFGTFLFATPEYSSAMKEKKLYPMGEKIYKQKCQTIDTNLYESYESLQHDIESKKLCSTLKPAHLEALSIYLWDKKHHLKSEKEYPKLTATKDEKCPVCGMFLYKYPTWLSRINYHVKSFGFDGIKDMIKYYFEHQEGIVEILVQDYYTHKTLEAREAFFVIGSDVYGPMGDELIAFKDKKSAQRFMIDHKGRELLRFHEITPERVYRLDE